MSAATISCPWCAKAIEPNADLQSGSRVHCPRCGAEFALTPEDLRAAVLAAPPAAPPILVGRVSAPAVVAPASARVWPLALTASAAALLFLMAASIGVVFLLAGKRSAQVAVVSKQPPAAAPKAADPLPPPAALPRRTEDDRPVLPPKPPAEVPPSPPPTDPTPPAHPPSPPPTDPTPPARPPSPPPVAPPEAPLRPAEEPRPAANPPPAAFKRRDRLAEEELRKQLLQVPEVALDAPGDARAATTLFTIAQAARNSGQAYPGSALLTRQRTDLNGLPLAAGLDCQLGKEPAENLQALSRKMRQTVASCLPADTLDPRPNADLLRQRLLEDDGKQWLTPDAVPCLLQMLQPENKPVRLILVEALGRIPGQRATQALAMRAMTDLSPEVREAAVKELHDRPREDSRDVLLHGLRYPWAPVIDHAAETLVALDDKEAAPSLVPLLDMPDPTVPTLIKKDKGQIKAVPELVRVNHLRNCVLCHEPSLDRQDLVRGAVPTQGQPLPAPATTPQYYDTGEHFVRADVTYLRQDFSVMQPVVNPGAWPDYQRFDYLIRLRRPKSSEYETADRADRPLGDEPRAAVLFALRELTGRDAGSTAAGWQAVLGKTAAAGPAAAAEATSGDWRQFRATLRPGADTPLSAAADLLKDQVLAADGNARSALVRKLAESDDPAGPTALARAIPYLTSGAQAGVRDALADRLGRLPEADLRDRLSDEDAEIRRAAARACAHREDKGKALTADLIPLLADDDATVADAAHDVLVGATGRDFGPADGATKADREKAKAAWEAWLANSKRE